MPAPSQRRVLGALFLLLAGLFALIAYSALTGGVWPVAFPAGALSLWMLTMAARSFRAR